MYNTPENRAAFVEHFGAECASITTAKIVLGALDSLPDYYWIPENLWRRVMQDDATHMLGERYLAHARKRGRRISNEKYERTAIQVTGEIYDFVKGLKEYKYD